MTESSPAYGAAITAGINVSEVRSKADNRLNVTGGVGAAGEPIAIVGMSCRFPGAVRDPEGFWQFLLAGGDGIGEVPADRWDADEFFSARPRTPGRIASRWGGFLNRVDRFDHEFFGISHREAVHMDPQQRIVLETAWEALEDAGAPPESVAGSDAGVFLAIYGIEYAGLLFADLDRINSYATIGNLHSVAAGRLSYVLDLHGPAVAVDAACASSLVAVHQACQSLRLGESSMAICGAVNLILSPHASISLSQLNESFVADGRIKTFDAAADGFVRSEGCGVVILKRLADAQAAGDLIYAVIRGSAVNQDGRGAGLTAPNGSAHRALMTRALAVAGTGPEQVALVETHGTGTKLGDPIEVDALADVYGRPEGPPVYLGAVKSNLGHLEAAAGMAGLIKAALCVERGLIPPNLHFNTLNPHIRLDGTTLAVPTEVTTWPEAAQPRVAAVSSFGLNGTNAHVVLAEPPPPLQAEPDRTRPCSVLALSARSEAALLKLARRYADRLETEAVDPADLCWSAATGRARSPHRLAVTGRSAAELAEGLADHVRGEPSPRVVTGRAARAAGADVVFLFSGVGGQRADLARELYRTQPTFRRTVDRCDAIVRELTGRSLGIGADDAPAAGPGGEGIEQTAPMLFAVEYALACLWQSWGIEPVAVLGHSSGEYAAATFAGAMSLEDGLGLVVRRAALLAGLERPGTMVAIRASRGDVDLAMADLDPATIAVAAVNGPTNLTASGTPAAVAALTERLTARGVQVTPVRATRSGHSPLVEPMLTALGECLRGVQFSAPQIPMVSGVTGLLLPWDRALDAEYWLRHTREPVQFAQGVATLAELGYRTFLEIGPGTDLLGMALESFGPDAGVLMLPSLRPRRSDWEVIASTASRLFVAGADVDWRLFDADYRRTRVRVPTYPFDPVRCWHDLAAPVSRNPDDDGLFAPARVGAAPADQEPAGWAPGVPGPVGLPTSERAPVAPTPEPASPAAEPVGVPAPERAAAAAARAAAAPASADPTPALATPADSTSALPTLSLPTGAAIMALEPAERIEALSGELVRNVQLALGYRSGSIDPDVPLTNLGLDSLMAVELRNEIQVRLGATLTVAEFLGGASIRDVAAAVVDQLTGAGFAAQRPVPVHGAAGTEPSAHAAVDDAAVDHAAVDDAAVDHRDRAAPPAPAIERVERKDDVLARLLAQVEAALPAQPTGTSTAGAQ